MKVKCDHRSKFSNLRNWKEEAWKKILKNFFFRLLLSNCLNWKIYCDDHSSLSSTIAVQIWIISYKLHRIPVVLESRRSSQGGVRAPPCTLPLDPPLRITTNMACSSSNSNSGVIWHKICFSIILTIFSLRSTEWNFRNRDISPF